MTTLSDEISSALEAEVAAVVDVLLESFCDPDAIGDPAVVADSLGRYLDHVERLGVLAEQSGLMGFSQVCSQFRGRLTMLASRESALADECRELLEEWPALAMGYLEALADPGASEALISHLQNPIWSLPLPEWEATDLLARLVDPWHTDLEEKPIAALQDETMAVAPEVSAEDVETPETAAPAAAAPQEWSSTIAPTLLQVDVSEVAQTPAVVEVPTVEEASPLTSTPSAMEVAIPAAEAELAVEAAIPATEEESALAAPAFVMVAESVQDWHDLPELPKAEIIQAPILIGQLQESMTDTIPTETLVVESGIEAVVPELTAHEAMLASPGSEESRAESESLKPELPEPEAAGLAAEMEPLESAVAATLEPESTREDEVATALPGFDQELVELLQSEVGAIIEATGDMKAVALDSAADTEVRSETLMNYAEQIARLADAAEALGLSGLQQTCAHLNGNVMAFASEARSLTAGEYELIAAWPARAMRYLQKLPDRSASQFLVDCLLPAGWPNPLPAEDVSALVELLAAPTFVVPEAMAVEARPLEALPEDVSLVLPEDVNPELLDSLLQELPSQTAELSAAIQRLAAGDGVLQDVEVAQRIAHTVKGAGNTVGVRGIASLTHHMEDILQAFSKHRALPNRRLAEALMSAVDCLEGMSEALVGLGAPPSQAREVLQTILDWANRIDREGLPKDDAVPHHTVPKPVVPPIKLGEMADVTEAAEAAEAAEAVKTAAVAAAGAQQATVPLLRVPATLVEELLRLVGESIILTGQVQERTRKALRQIRAVQAQHQVFQQLTADLEQLVEIRGIAPSQTKIASKNGFDPLELEQYNELNTVTHRLLEAAADSRALGQDIREGLNALDDLLVTQGRLHRQSQEAVLRTRMVSVKTIVPRLQRSVRQTCRLTDKEVDFLVAGDATLMDSDLLADIVDPLMHVLRNAVDHGIESPERRLASGKNPVGRINLSFVREGDTIVVRCRDDGAGLDFATIRRVAKEKGLIAADAEPGEAELSQLIVNSGFSTRTEATQTSGRGIGLDAVYSRIRGLKGSFQIRSETGRGCLMEFRLPVTLIAVHALLVRLHGQRFAVSSRGIQQILYVGLGEIRQLGAKTVYQLGDDFYELVSLGVLLNLSKDRRDAERQTPAMFLVRDGTGVTRAVLADEVLDSRDLVVKPLGRYFPRLPGIVGATILGDGGVVPVLDLPELLSAPLSDPLTPTYRERTPTPTVPRPKKRMALVVDDSLSARRALAQAVEDAGFDVRTARDGLEAVAIIEAQRPDLLLVDLEMPRMNGLELTAHIRGREPTRTLPVIMVTSRSTAKHRREAEAVGVNFYMTKPFTDDELLQNIHSALNAGVAVSG